MKNFAKTFWKIVLGACYTGIAVALVGQFLGQETGPAAVPFVILIVAINAIRGYARKLRKFSL